LVRGGVGFTAQEAGWRWFQGMRAMSIPIAQVLMGGERSVSELVEELGTTQANISKQLRVLYDGRILTREKRGNQVFYAIGDEIVKPLCELVCGKLNRDVEQAQGYEFSI